MTYPPLQTYLLDHFADPLVTAGSQKIFTSTRPTDDGWVMAVIRIDDCTCEVAAVFLGTRIREDVLIHLCFSNQEAVPAEAVDVEHGVPDGAGWSVAVYVTLRSMREAETMVGFLPLMPTHGSRNDAR